MHNTMQAYLRQFSGQDDSVYEDYLERLECIREVCAWHGRVAPALLPPKQVSHFEEVLEVEFAKWNGQMGCSRIPASIQRLEFLLAYTWE